MNISRVPCVSVCADAVPAPPCPAIRAAEYMTRTGPVVNLRVAKQAAAYHGLTTLLSQPSPVMTRGRPGLQGREGWTGARCRQWW